MVEMASPMASAGSLLVVCLDQGEERRTGGKVCARAWRARRAWARARG